MRSTGRYTRALRTLAHYSHDKCSECGGKLTREIPALAGYTSEGKEIYVGECCKSLIAELASHEYWWWTTYKRPEARTPLVRYMDFAKFVAMLKDRAIYFVRWDRLGDPFEGARGLVSREEEFRAYNIAYFEHAIRTRPGGTGTLTEEEIKLEAATLAHNFSKSSFLEMNRSYVSCWHGSDVESEALWRLYCPPPSSGVAIRTDFLTLSSALSRAFDIKFGQVQYIDFKTGYAGTHDRIFWKRNSLSHEQEIRAVVQKGLFDEPKDDGINVPVDIATFMHRIIISPFAPRWFEDVLTETLRRFGLDATPSPSVLAAEPFF